MNPQLMSSNRPYLVRALYEWIVDNNLTPYLLVDAAHPDVQVPRGFVDDNRIILNASPDATHSLVLGNEAVMFNARFGGRPMEVMVPMSALLAIYAKENGRGMVFGPQDEGLHPGVNGKDAEAAPATSGPGDSSSSLADATATPPRPASGKPNLKIIK